MSTQEGQDVLRQRIVQLSRNTERALNRVKASPFLESQAKIKAVTQLDAIIRRCSLLSGLLLMPMTLHEFHSMQVHEIDFIRSSERTLESLQKMIL